MEIENKFSTDKKSNESSNSYSEVISISIDTTIN